MAQIASKLSKPRGFVVVPVGEVEEFLAPLGIGKLPGIGAKAEAGLDAQGFRLVGDILTRNEGDLARAFGDGWREVVAMARGQDTRPVEMTDEDAKSYSQQETFHEDLGDFAAVARIAKRMVDELLALVRADGKRVKTITVKVRYGDFTQMAHGRSLATASDLEVRFYPLVETLLREAWTQRRKLRLVSVRFSGVEHGAEQLEMFNQSDEKRRKLAAVLDRMNAGEKKPRVLHGHQLGAEEPS